MPTLLRLGIPTLIVLVVQTLVGVIETYVRQLPWDRGHRRCGDGVSGAADVQMVTNRRRVWRRRLRWWPGTGGRQAR